MPRILFFTRPYNRGMKKILLLSLSGFIISLSSGAQAQTNLITNPGFESKLTGWKNNGYTSAVTGKSKSGTYSARSGTAAGGLQQTLTNKLVAGNIYKLSFWGKIGTKSVSSMVSLRVKNSSGGIMILENLPVLSTTYTLLI